MKPLTVTVVEVYSASSMNTNMFIIVPYLMQRYNSVTTQGFLFQMQRDSLGSDRIAS